MQIQQEMSPPGHIYTDTACQMSATEENFARNTLNADFLSKPKIYKL